MKEKRKDLQVTALENGTVIDHIPTEKLFTVVSHNKGLRGCREEGNQASRFTYKRCEMRKPCLHHKQRTYEDCIQCRRQRTRHTEMPLLRQGTVHRQHKTCISTKAGTDKTKVQACTICRPVFVMKIRKAVDRK